MNPTKVYWVYLLMMNGVRNMENSTISISEKKTGMKKKTGLKKLMILIFSVYYTISEYI